MSFKENELIRLMDCLNFKKINNEYVYDSSEVEIFRKKGSKIIQWLPQSDNLVNVEIRMPDNSIIKGIGEPSIADLKKGSIVQFLRFGFCRLDEIKGKTFLFWFTHK